MTFYSIPELIEERNALAIDLAITKFEAALPEIIAAAKRRDSHRKADKRYREKQKAKRQKAIHETSQKLREELAA